MPSEAELHLLKSFRWLPCESCWDAGPWSHRQKGVELQEVRLSRYPTSSRCISLADLTSKSEDVIVEGRPPNLPTYLRDYYLSQGSNRYQKPEWCGARFPDPTRYCNNVHTIMRDLFYGLPNLTPEPTLCCFSYQHTKERSMPFPSWSRASWSGDVSPSFTIDLKTYSKPRARDSETHIAGSSTPNNTGLRTI